MSDVGKSQQEEDHSQTTLYYILNLTFQYFYNHVSNWEWNHEDDVLNLYREVEDIIENKAIIPKSVFEKNPDLKPEKFDILYDFLRLGIILYQSNYLSYSIGNKTSRASNFEFLPPEVTLLTTTRYHLAKLNQSIGNLNYINVLISHLKFERFLVAFFLKHTRSVHISFTGYAKGHCSELDMKFHEQIKLILLSFHQIDWRTLTSRSHLSKILSRVQATRELLISRLIKDYLHSNENKIVEALNAYYAVMHTSPFNFSNFLTERSLCASTTPFSSTLDQSSHPETTLDRLNHSISLHMKNNPGINLELITNNFLIRALKCNISTEKAHKIVAKYAKNDTLNQSFSPEDDQGTSFTGLIDFLIQITGNPDAMISLLRLISSGRHPSIRYSRFVTNK